MMDLTAPKFTVFQQGKISDSVMDVVNATPKLKTEYVSLIWQSSSISRKNYSPFSTLIYENNYIVVKSHHLILIYLYEIFMKQNFKTIDV